jgi:hypothetical protein
MTRLAVYRWPRRPLAPGVLHVGSAHLEVTAGLGPRDISDLPHSGFYDRVAGRLLLLYLRGDVLWLRAAGTGGTLDVPFDASVTSEWVDRGRAGRLRRWLRLAPPSTFRLLRNGEPVLEFSYVQANWDVPRDPTPFRDPEVDDDFVRFLHDVLADPERGARVTAGISPAA